MACCGLRRYPCWWNYPNSWPPHTCGGWGPTWGEKWWDLWWAPLLHVWRDWHWHYTEGWGSLGTITVAILAIIVSALYNRRTLALATQQRTDTRGDVLRTELAAWLTLVGEIEWTCADLLRRIRQMTVKTDENDTLDDAEVIRRARKLKSSVRQELSEPLRNYNTQLAQIQMLTADEIIVTNIHFITQAMTGKTQLLDRWIDMVINHANRTPEEQQQRRQNYLLQWHSALRRTINTTGRSPLLVEISSTTSLGP